MTSLTIYHGQPKPVRITGKHCVHLATFAQKHPGWHTAANNRATRDAVAALKRKGCLEVEGDQFKWRYPK